MADVTQKTIDDASNTVDLIADELKKNGVPMHTSTGVALIAMGVGALTMCGWNPLEIIGYVEMLAVRQSEEYDDTAKKEMN